jgi:hypothetical protein
MNRLVSATLGVALFCVSCSGGSASTEDLDFSGNQVAVVEAKYPVDYGNSRVAQLIEGTGDNRWQRELAVSKVTATCMRDAGYEYPDIRWSKDQIVSDWVRPRHTPLSLAEAETEGYGPLPSFSPPPETESVELEGEALSRYRDTELDCVVLGLDSAFGNFEAYEKARLILEEKVSEFEDAFRSAEPVQALAAAWSECMSSVGYSFDDPEQARADSIATPQARAIATADAKCRVTTDYDAAWWTFYESAEADFMSKNETLVVDVYDLGRAPSTESD